jgi:chemotaxis protein methyltransferase CheR
MYALRIESYHEYLAYLKLHGEDRHELQKLLQFLTVGETYFFRYPAHFEALRERFNPPPPVDRPIRIWSAGCSTGEEPYSIAITLMEALPDWRDRDIRIIATDINNRSLKLAREGVYSPWSLRITQGEQIGRYFDRVGQSFLIRDEVKRLVHFCHLNLSGPGQDEMWHELSALDAIFCRDVLIYFRPQAADQVLRRLAGALKFSGQLFLGHAETLLPHESELEIRRQGKTFFYLKSAPRTPQAPQAPPCAKPAPQAIRGLPAVPTRAAAPKAVSTPPPAACAPPPPAPLGVAAARELFDQEEFDRAQELLDRILAEDPANAAALVLVAFIQAGKGALQLALKTCCRALELNDLLPEAYFLKGVILDAEDRLAEAADEYRKALLLEHEFVMPRYHMGRLHLRQGRRAEAAREIRNSIRILARHDGNDTVPFSGGLTRAVCMMQLQNALAQVA